jgi:hypothetical protein
MFSNYRKYLPEGSEGDTCLIDVEKNLTIAQRLDLLQIPVEKPKVITVNDQNQKENYLLKKNDFVKIFPVAMGG